MYEFTTYIVCVGWASEISPDGKTGLSSVDTSAPHPARGPGNSSQSIIPYFLIYDA